jgi:hypothetical protein
MRKGVLADDWPMVANTAAAVAEKVKKTVVPKRHNLGTPWEGAWDRLKNLETSNSYQR